MAVVADLERRFGVGWPGIALYLALFLAGIAALEFLGELPSTRYSSRAPIEVVVPGLVYGLGLAGVTVAASSLPTYARLALTGETAPADAATGDGWVVLTGTAERAGGTIETPVEGRDAVAYTTRVLANDHDDAERARDSEEHWSAVHVGESTTSFAVAGDRGAAPVDPDGARLRLSDREELLVTAGEPLPDDAAALLESADLDVDPASTHLRFEAAALEPGDPAFVAGRAAGGRVDADLVAEGDHPARLRARVVRGGALGVLATAAGLLGLAVVAGVP